jgi:hypothetical protein
MSEYQFPTESLEQREERFRYVDKTHPLMQVLFKMNLPETPVSENAE